MYYDFGYKAQDDREEVECEIEYDDCIEGEDGSIRPGVRVICTKCGNVSESFGQTEKSIKRCLALLHETCLMEEDNFYIEE